MYSMLPKIKKELKSFILGESGGASKQALISMGAMFAGFEALNLFSKGMGADISSKHDHCDPGHSEAHNSGTRGGWGHWSSEAHSSADGVPASHCDASNHGSGNSGSGSAGWGHGNNHRSANASHKNYIVLNYG